MMNPQSTTVTFPRERRRELACLTKGMQNLRIIRWLKSCLLHGWGNDDGYGGIIAERVAIGNIIRLAKEEYKVGPRWIVLE